MVMTVRNKEKAVSNGDSEELISNSLPHLPYDIIIYNILTRVPIDSLMRFRCVCKTWSSLPINDIEFIRRSYGKRGFIRLLENCSTDDDDDCSIITRVYRCAGIGFFDIDKKEERVFCFRPESGLLDEKLRISDSLNGLVLFASWHEFSGYHVYNPITGYTYKLPTRNAFDAEFHNHLYFRLVFDSVTNKYKVLCFCRIVYQYFLKIVTLGTENDSWNDVDFPKMHPCLGKFEQVFANGSFNWLTRESEILSFDVSNQVFSSIKYPKGCSNTSKLLEIEGSLCFVDYTDNAEQVYPREPGAYKGNLKLWILKKENGHQHEWIQKYDIIDIFRNTIVPRNFIRSRSSPEIVAVVLHPAPKIIFRVSVHDINQNGGTNECYCYDVKLERLDIIIRKYGLRYKWHISSLAPRL